MIPIEKIHFELKLALDKVDTLNTPNLLPNEIDTLIWIGIKNWYKDLVKNFEVTKEITNKLSPFHNLREDAVISAGTSGEYIVDLSSLSKDYFSITKLEVEIENSNCKKNCTAYHLRDNNVDTQYNNPSFEWGRVPYKIGANNQTLYLYSDNKFTINNIKISYLSLPLEPFIGGYTSLNEKYTSTDPTVDSDINEIYLNEIINYTLQEIKL